MIVIIKRLPLNLLVVKNSFKDAECLRNYPESKVGLILSEMFSFTERIKNLEKKIRIIVQKNSPCYEGLTVKTHFLLNIEKF